MDIKIEKDIPVPTRKKNELLQSLSAMQVGDSFAVPIAKRSKVLMMAGRLHGLKFISRTLDDTTARIWRVE